jgi:hypothetical protein
VRAPPGLLAIIATVLTIGGGVAAMRTVVRDDPRANDSHKVQFG